MFLTVFNFVKGSKAVQYLLLGLLAAGLYGAWVLHQRNIGKDQEKQVVTKGIGEEVKQDKAKFGTDLTASQDREAKFINAANKSADTARAALASAQALQRQSDDLRRQLASRPDAELHSDTIRTLGLRLPTDPVVACYTVSEERAINDAVHQAPVCRDLNNQKDVTIAAQASQVNEVLKRVDELLARDKSRAVYTDRLESAVVKLYNQHPPKTRAWGCIKLWKCGEGKLVLPDLAELKGVTHD